MTCTVLVTGSRDWDDEESIQKVLNNLVSMEYRGTEFHLIHGGAVGADQITARLASAMGWSTQEFKPDWKRYSRGAGFVRNQEMVDQNPTICIAFIKNNSNGASDCARRAEKAGIPVLCYFQNDEG